MLPLLLLALVSLSLCEPIEPPQQPPLPFVPRLLSPNDKLLMAQVVWRHGDRSPVQTYKTGLHNESEWLNGWGELTQLGMRQQYALGRVLYRRYVAPESPSMRPLLSNTYNAKEVYIRSTDVNRTLISAYANIAGMFAGGDAGTDFPDYVRWPSSWTPVPVHTIDLDEDYIGNVFAPCPRAQELDSELRNSTEFRQVTKDNQDFLDWLSEKTGEKIDLTNIYLINDVHHIELLYNKSQPEWITPEVSARLRNLTQIANEYTYGIGKPYVPEMIKLRGGSMLRAIMQKMYHKLACEKAMDGVDCKWMGPLKYYAYSAHDTTVAAFLTTLGDEERVIRGGLPKYTASVSVELWELEGEGPAVRILFHGAFHHNYHVITHLTKGCPSNAEFCSLKVFEKRSRAFMPTNIQKECRPRGSLYPHNKFQRKLKATEDF